MYHSDFGFREDPFELGFDPRHYYVDTRRQAIVDRVVATVRRELPAIIIEGPSDIGKTALLLHLAQVIPAATGVTHVFGRHVFSCTKATTLEQVLQACRNELLPVAAALDPELSFLNLGATAASPGCDLAYSVFLIDDVDLLSPEILSHVAMLPAVFAKARKRVLVVAAAKPGFSWPSPEPASGANNTVEPIARFELPPLCAEAMHALVQHRLCVAGATGADLFDTPALEALVDISGGLPGQAVRLARLALSMARREHAVPILAEIVEDAATRLGIICPTPVPPEGRPPLDAGIGTSQCSRASAVSNSGQPSATHSGVPSAGASLLRRQRSAIDSPAAVSRGRLNLSQGLELPTRLGESDSTSKMLSVSPTPFGVRQARGPEAHSGLLGPGEIASLPLVAGHVASGMLSLVLIILATVTLLIAMERLNRVELTQLGGYAASMLTALGPSNDGLDRASDRP